MTRKKDWGAGRSVQTVEVTTDPAKLAYLAGIIDGEGSIVPYNKSAAKRYWRIVVGNTSEDLIQWLKSNFGGTVHDRRQSWNSWLGEAPPHQGQRHMWGWYIGRQADVFAILSAVEPYLVIKRGRANVALEEIRKNIELTLKVTTLGQ